MADARTHRLGGLAIGLAVVGSLAAIVNEVVSYRRTGVVDWGHCRAGARCADPHLRRRQGAHRLASADTGEGFR